MSSLTGLSKRQVQVLWAVQDSENDGLPATGRALLGVFRESALETHMDASTQGLHQTAASLVRKGALSKGFANNQRSHGVAYSITIHGQDLLRRECAVHGRPL